MVEPRAHVAIIATATRARPPAPVWTCPVSFAATAALNGIVHRLPTACAVGSVPVAAAAAAIVNQTQTARRNRPRCFADTVGTPAQTVPWRGAPSDGRCNVQGLLTPTC